MARRLKTTVSRANSYQTLGERIKWLRVHSKPYMTREQLETLSGIGINTIWGLENGKGPGAAFIPRLATIRRLANALNADVIIKIKPRHKYVLQEGEILLAGPPLPPVQRPKTKLSVRARTLAAKLEHSPWSTSARQKRQRRPKATSEISGSPSPEQEE